MYNPEIPYTPNFKKTTRHNNIKEQPERHPLRFVPHPIAWEQIKKPLLYFLLLFVLLSLAYFHFGTYCNWPYKIESDGKYYYQYLVSGFYDGDFDFTNNYRTPKYDWMHLKIDHYELKEQVNPITNRPTNLFTLGQSILWTPFFLITRLSGYTLRAFGFQVDTNPWGKFFQYGIMYSAVIYTLITLFLLYRLLNRYFDKTPSIYATWMILFSTNLFYYTVFEPSMSHVYDLFTFVVFIFIFIQAVESPSLLWYIALAIAAAFHILVRTQNILTIILFSLLLFLIPLTMQWKLPSLKLTGIYLGLLLFGLLPIPLLNTYLFGNPLTIPQGTSFLDLKNPKIFEVLFSPRNGLFSTHPSLSIAFFSFQIFVIYIIKTKDRSESIFFIALLIAFALQAYINSATSDWWGGESFGQRRLISSFPLFAFGFAYLTQYLQRLSPILCMIIIGAGSIYGIYLTLNYVSC